MVGGGGQVPEAFGGDLVEPPPAECLALMQTSRNWGPVIGLTLKGLHSCLRPTSASCAGSTKPHYRARRGVCRV